uniref:RRM domain-containing protein n=1 Tax=Araucaria cunninghamii TaxID=56994 RepID=A0A0D6R9L5_ARACU
MSSGNRKLVVLGIPWDVDTEGLREYMCQFGDLEDVIVMKDRASGRSRGFGYVTFCSSEVAEKAMATQHLLQGRVLEVKIATPKDEMRPTIRKITRIFVARIPPTVTDEMFRSYFEKYGSILDAYMPKDQITKNHRGIGFVTYENAESVDKIMSENHELGGSTIAVDRATPKEDTWKLPERPFSGASGLFNSCSNTTCSGNFGLSPYGGYGYTRSDIGTAAVANIEGNNGGSVMWPSGPPAQQAGPYGAPLPGMLVTDPLVSNYGSTYSQVAPPRMGKKLFVGRIPVEATSEDLRLHFSQFGRILDVYLPKDAKKLSHRGFGFVTFADESTAEFVAQKRHEILGHLIAVDRASPLDEIQNGKYYGNLSVSSAVGAPLQGLSTVAGNSFGSVYPPTTSRMGKKIFIGRIPIEATSEGLRMYFSQYGRILDVYLPKDAKKISHRGFGFVTFADETAAERVAQDTHEILGHQIAVDRAAPLDEIPSGGAGGPLRGHSSKFPGSNYGNMPANLGFNSGWTPYGNLGSMASSDEGLSGHRVSRVEARYRPY